jgi:hypothetical protein
MTFPPFELRHSPSNMADRTYTEYSANTKHSILLEYKAGVRGWGFHALANKHHVRGGSTTVKYWYDRWDGTPESLEKRTTSNKRRKLNEEEVKQHIRGYVEEQNQESEPVGYHQVQQHVQQETKQHIPITTIKRYGHDDAKLSYKRTTRTLNYECTYTSHAC